MADDPMPVPSPRPSQKSARDRRLHRIERRLDGPMVFLAFVWIGLLVIDFAGGRHPWLDAAGHLIWGVFVADFVLRWTLAEKKVVHLRRNWLTLVSLALPALRVFRLMRVLRLSRATRGLRLLRLTTSLNRSIRALMRSMQRKGAAYVVALTVVVILAGAAGMYAFEEKQFTSYWDALWWTAMVVTTMGSEGWPRSLEGRLLCLALALYAFSVFGYVTAALASVFVERGRSPEESTPQAVRNDVAELKAEIARLTTLLDKER